MENASGNPLPGNAPQAGQTPPAPQSPPPPVNIAITVNAPSTGNAPPAGQAPSGQPVPGRYRHITHPRVGTNALIVAIYICIVVLIVAAIAAVFLAKSGLVDIPFISSKLYRGPAVSRTVKAEAASLDAFIEGIGKKLTEAERISPKPPYRVKITESEFTGALRGSLADYSKDSGVVLDRVQAVITPRDIELSGSAVKNGFTFNILASYRPVLRGDRLILEPVRVQLGDFPFATSTVQSIFAYLFTRDLGEWRLEVENRTLTGIELGEGSLDLVFVPK